MRLSATATALILAAGLAGCGGGAPAPPERSPEELKAAQAALPAPYSTADLENGRALFRQCRSCHTVTAGGANLTGPNLHGVVGRPAGALPGYAYSAPMRQAGLVWEPAKLDAYLAEPRAVVPGTKMSFVGLKAAQERIDVIAYLMLESPPAP